jgi:replicative DNA helicase
VALADDRGTGSSQDGFAGYDGTFEKQPPQDVAAEQSVLGGMMLSKDAIADVVEVLRPGDFYRPAHQAIYDCVLELYGRGEPVDAITVSAELERRQELLRVGGAPYMHTLIATVPTAANAGYYAEIVAEKAVLRRLIEAGTRIVQLGYHGSEGSAIDEIVDRAQAAVYDVTERRTSEDYAPLEELLQPTMDEIDAIASRGGESIGIPTGFSDLDAVTNGLHPGQMIIVAARPGVGKALALDTALPTPAGWTEMGEVRTGDELIGVDGRPIRVVAVTDVLIGRPCYEVEFSDGTVIVADAEHQWVVDGRVQSTERLCGLGGALTVPAHAPVQLPVRDLPVPPYVLGVWLAAGDPADGNLQVSDQALLDMLELEGVKPVEAMPVFHSEIAEGLVELGVWNDQDIPIDYLRAGYDQRRALLAGLLDAAGSVDGRALVRLVVSQPMSVRARELVLSLGYPCTAVATANSSLATGFDVSTLVFDSGPDEVFRLDHKNARHRNRSAAAPSRTIVGVRRVDSVPVRCVQVAAADGLYLASRSMIPTHNSTLGLDFARSASIRNGMASVIFSLEMGRTEIVMRLLSAEARIRLGDIRGGRLTDDDWTRLARLIGEISDAPLFIDDSPNLTMMEIRAKARRLKQRNDIRLIVVDYMQLMTSGKRFESRQQEVSEFSRHLKLLAKELEVPVVAISQLNRGPEQRTDKRPQLADLRESGCLTATTRLLRADTGTEITFGELIDSGLRPVVWSVDRHRRWVPRLVTHVFCSGIKEVFRVRLGSGRQVEVTANHPMLTPGEWRPVGHLGPGDLVAVPACVPEPLEVRPLPEPEIVMTARRVASGDLRVDGVPERVFTLPTAQLELFLRRVWWEQRRVSTGGPGSMRAGYLPSTRRLAEDLQLLLLRLSLRSRLCREDNGDLWSVQVCGTSRQTFLHRMAGSSGVRPAAVSSGDRRREPVAAGLGLRTPAQGRDVAVATAPGDEPHAGDLMWDEIVDVTSLGEQAVFDATVAETHNFVADGIVLHNSIEQDSDMVILIHRPDAFERDDPRMGEADLILAKHRSGPTTTVTVAHQLHYSRFVDMARE